MNKIEELIKKLKEEKSDLTVKANYKRSLQNELKQDLFKEEDIADKHMKKTFIYLAASAVVGATSIFGAIIISPFTLFATLPIFAGCMYKTFKHFSKGDKAVKNRENFKKAGDKYQSEINTLEKEKEKIQAQIDILTKYKNGQASLEEVKDKISTPIEEDEMLPVTDVKVENDTILSTKPTAKKQSTKQEELTVVIDQIEVVKE